MVKVNTFTSVHSRLSFNVFKVHMQMVVWWQIVEVRFDLALWHVEVLLNCLHAFTSDWFQKVEVLSSQISDRSQIPVLISDDGKAIESVHLTFIVLPVFLQDEVLIVKQVEFLFFLTTKYWLNPVAVRHVHGIDKVGFDNIMIDLSCLTDNLSTLFWIFRDQSLTCRVYQVTLHSILALRQVNPELTELIVVEILLLEFWAQKQILTLLFCFLFSWLELQHLNYLILFELLFLKDEDDLVVCEVSLKSSKHVNCFLVWNVVKNALKNKLIHV